MGAPWNESRRNRRLRLHTEVIRGPMEWGFDLTTRCVGACLHCYNRSPNRRREELEDDLVLDVIEQIAEQQPRGFCFCGGDPLLRFDVLCEGTRRLARSKIKASVVTTGHLLTRDKAERLRDAGIGTVQVSLDGARPESHERLRRLQGAFATTVRALAILQDVGIPSLVAFAPTQFNTDELSDVIALARSLGVIELRVQPLMPLGEALLNWPSIAPTQEQYRGILSTVAEHCAPEDGGASLKIEWGDPIDHLIRFGQFYEGIAANIHITADGWLQCSPYLPVAFGNVRRHRLSEYWHGGLARVWDLRVVRDLAYRIRSIEDLARTIPVPFFTEPVELDLLDDPPALIEQRTDWLLDLARTHANRMRREGILPFSKLKVDVMNPSVRPKFDESNLPYFRLERKGFATTVGDDGVGEYQLVNPGAMVIARLCNGNRNFDEIVAEYHRLVPGPGPDAAKHLVQEGLTLLGRYGLLTTTEDAGVRAECPELFAAPDELVVRELLADDFHTIRDLLVGTSFPNFEVVPKVFFRDPTMVPVAYEELMLRMRLFVGKEKLFGAFRNRRLELLMGLVDLRPIKPATALSLLAGHEATDLEALLPPLTAVATNRVREDFSKMTWAMKVLPGPDVAQLIELAKTVGWKERARIENEYGPGIDELLLERTW